MFGFELLSEANTSLVDSSFNTLKFHDRVGFNASGSGYLEVPGSEFLDGYFPVGRPGSGMAIGSMSIWDPGSGKQQLMVIDGSGDIFIDWYRKDAAPSNPDDFGVEVFDSSGNEVFHSKYTYLRITDFVTVSRPSSSPGATRSFSHRETPGAFYFLNTIRGFMSSGDTGYALVLGNASSTGARLQWAEIPDSNSDGEGAGPDDILVVVCKPA